jgi:hypothetical protein
MCVLRALLAALSLALCLPPQVPAGPSAGLRARAAAVLDDAGCQTALPDETGTGGGEAGREGRTGGRVLPREVPPPRPLLGDVPVRAAELLMWVSIGVAALLVLIVIVRSASTFAEQRRRPAAEPVTARRIEPGAAPELPDHAALAASGDFAAAIHALLRHAFTALGRRCGGLPDHVTGRGLVRRAAQEAVPTEALARLVQAVELLHFGGRPAEARHYQDSVQVLQRWEAACAKPR